MLSAEQERRRAISVAQFDYHQNRAKRRLAELWAFRTGKTSTEQQKKSCSNNERFRTQLLKSAHSCSLIYTGQ